MLEFPKAPLFGGGTLIAFIWRPLQQLFGRSRGPHPARMRAHPQRPSLRKSCWRPPKVILALLQHRHSLAFHLAPCKHISATCMHACGPQRWGAAQPAAPAHPEALCLLAWPLRCAGQLACSELLLRGGHCCAGGLRVLGEPEIQGIPF